MSPPLPLHHTAALTDLMPPATLSYEHQNMDTLQLQPEKMSPHSTDIIPPKALPHPPSIRAQDEATAPSASAKQPMEYPRASFMGIPPEMRMRIYGFLVNGGRVIDPGSRGAECAGDTGVGEQFGCGDHYRFVEPKCVCTESVWPQILATNSIIFMEAMPVLYSTTEFHVPFPAKYEHRYKIEESKIALRAMPTYGIRHIKHLALPAALSNMRISLFPNGPDSLLYLHWDWLKSLDLKLSSIRLQVITTSYHAMTCDRRYLELDVTPFLGLLSISTARTIYLQVPCDLDEEIEYPSDTEMELAEDENGVRKNVLRDGLLAALRKEAKQLDHHPDVIDISDKWMEYR